MTKKASLHKLSKRRLVEMHGVEPSKTADALLKWQPRAVKVRVIRQACVPFGVNSREVSVPSRQPIGRSEWKLLNWVNGRIFAESQENTCKTSQTGIKEREGEISSSNHADPLVSSEPAQRSAFQHETDWSGGQGGSTVRSPRLGCMLTHEVDSGCAVCTNLL